MLKGLKSSQTVARPLPLVISLFRAFVVFSLIGASAWAAEMVAEARPNPGTIVFFGDSLTAGYGLDNPGVESYPARIQKKIFAANLPWRVVNAGLSGETSAGGSRRVDWILRQPVTIFVLALGGNDGLRGLAPDVTQRNLASILARVKSTHPDAKLVVAGMMMPANMGEEYARDFRAVFPAIAKESGATLMPFLLEGVGGDPKLNQPDGIHPTPEGHVIVAENVWRVLEPLLKQ